MITERYGNLVSEIVRNAHVPLKLYICNWVINPLVNYAYIWIRQMVWAGGSDVGVVRGGGRYWEGGVKNKTLTPTVCISLVMT